MKKEPVVCILDEDVSIREPPLHLIRSHGFDVDSFLEMKHTDCMNLGVGTRAARTAGSHAMGGFYRPCSVQQGGLPRAVECLGARFDGSERRLA